MSSRSQRDTPQHCSSRQNINNHQLQADHRERRNHHSWSNIPVRNEKTFTFTHTANQTNNGFTSRVGKKICWASFAQTWFICVLINNQQKELNVFGFSSDLFHKNWASICFSSNLFHTSNSFWSILPKLWKTELKDAQEIFFPLTGHHPTNIWSII